MMCCTCCQHRRATKESRSSFPISTMHTGRSRWPNQKDVILSVTTGKNSGCRKVPGFAQRTSVFGWAFLAAHSVHTFGLQWHVRLGEISRSKISIVCGRPGNHDPQYQRVPRQCHCHRPFAFPNAQWGTKVVWIGGLVKKFSDRVVASIPPEKNLSEFTGTATDMLKSNFVAVRKQRKIAGKIESLLCIDFFKPQTHQHWIPRRLCVSNHSKPL